jgi:hypothetical protein
MLCNVKFAALKVFLATGVTSFMHLKKIATSSTLWLANLHLSAKVE